MPGRRPQVMMLQAEGVAIDSCLVGHSMFVCQWWIAQKNNHHIILYDHGKKKLLLPYDDSMMIITMIGSDRP